MAIINLPLHFEWQVKVGGVATRHRTRQRCDPVFTTSLARLLRVRVLYVKFIFLIKNIRAVDDWLECAAESLILWIDSKLETFFFIFSLSVVFFFDEPEEDVQRDVKFQWENSPESGKHSSFPDRLSVIFNYASAAEWESEQLNSTKQIIINESIWCRCELSLSHSADPNNKIKFFNISQNMIALCDVMAQVQLILLHVGFSCCCCWNLSFICWICIYIISAHLPLPQPNRMLMFHASVYESVWKHNARYTIQN